MTSSRRVSHLIEIYLLFNIEKKCSFKGEIYCTAFGYTSLPDPQRSSYGSPAQ